MWCGEPIVCLWLIEPLLLLFSLQISRQLMARLISRIDCSDFLQHHDPSLNVSQRSMLQAARHLEHIADVECNYLIGAQLFGVLRRSGLGGKLESHCSAGNAVEDFVSLWMTMPDEGALDLRDLEGVRGVHCQEMLGLPVTGDALDAGVEVDGFHGR